MKTCGFNHNSTLRDFFRTCETPQSAELATGLPDHLFRRSLTSLDEKFSMSRHIYSNTNVDKRSEKQTIPTTHLDDAEICPNRLLVLKEEKSPVEETDCMSEEEKLYLYKQLLHQNKRDDHPALLKHRRLMLDFQTRRTLLRPDNIVLPISVLQDEGNFGLHGKIVHMNQPINQVRNIPTREKDDEKRQNQARNLCRDRPKSVPNNPTSHIRAKFDTIRPATSLNRPQHQNASRTIKPHSSYLPLRYRSAVYRRPQSKESLPAGHHLQPHFTNDRNVITPNKSMDRGSEAYDAEDNKDAPRTIKPHSSYLPLRYRSAVYRRPQSKERLPAGYHNLQPQFPNDRNVNTPNKSIDRGSEAYDSEDNRDTIDEPLVTFRSLESDSKPISEPNVLSLNVFIPREIEEVRKCNDPELQNPPNSPKKETNPNERVRNNEKIPNSSQKSKHKSPDGIPLKVKELLAKRSDQYSSCARFQYTHSRTLTPRITANFKSAVHCEVFGPGLCTDCQMLNTRNNIMSRDVHSRFPTFPSTLRLEGHKTTYI